MTGHRERDEERHDEAEFEAGRKALEMLAAARATGDAAVIACAEMLVYVAGQKIASQIASDRAKG